jgi:hypothetical protein
MTDYVWAVRVGTLPSLKATIKKLHTKKMAKLGFFVEMEELDEHDNQRLIRAYNKCEDFTLKPFSKAIPYNLIASGLDGSKRDTSKQFYVARILGPKLLNGVPREENLYGIQGLSIGKLQLKAKDAN